MKFFCDQMLVRLGRWLRAAGYDTLIAEDFMTDAEIYATAEELKRHLITRDKHFVALDKGRNLVIWLESNSVEKCAEELSRKVAIDWLKNPFSRCLLCNCPFETVLKEDLRDIPEDILAQNTEFKKCPKCKKIYWMGSHTDKMKKQLEYWLSL